jgi:hypothetical protein
MLADASTMMDHVAQVAGRIVLETPKGNKWTPAYVRRDLIAELEVALCDAGYDMAEARKHFRELAKKR